MKYFCLFGVAALLLGVSTEAGVIINELHTLPDVDTELVKFIELYNDSADAVDISNWKLTKAVEFTFPPGSTIAAGGYAVIGENPAALQTKFGVTVYGPWVGNLSSQGDDLVLQNALGKTQNEVQYQGGFPWPTVGDAPGYSLELINPAFDNSLGGNWRPSVAGDYVPTVPKTIVPIDQVWRFDQSGTDLSATAWKTTAYNDSSWRSGPALIFQENAALPAAKNTAITNYTSATTTYYFRTHFNFSGDTAKTTLELETVLDDGAVIYLNGAELYRLGMPGGIPGYSTHASRNIGDASYEGPFSAPNASLVQGDNVLAVEVHQATDVSSDIVWGMSLTATTTLDQNGRGPTPGAKNAAFATNAPPAVRQVDNTPQQPKTSENVVITSKVTDPDGVQAVTLEYQVVNPGQYIALADAAYQTSWTTVAMNDSGVAGDAIGGDGVYSVTLPGSLQTHRRLVRYRITATDSYNKSIRVPYGEDAQPNFAYFVYDGVPSWRGAIQPGGPDQTRASLTTYSTNIMGRLPVYHLITKASSVFESQFQESGDANEAYKWTGTLVYDGKVYDHMRYKSRGGVWRHAMGKNAWKLNFNQGHRFEEKDDYGNKYNTTHDKLNFRPLIQQGDYRHRGEQGMFESVSLRMFNMLGVAASRTHWFQFRVVDAPAEYGPTQYDGDFWGLYLAVEEGDGDFLKEHNLPDGNFYMMGENLGEKQNQGRTSAPDNSDLLNFVNAYEGSPSTAWWRTNLELNTYYSYRTVIEAVHHYDVDDPPGKNYQYYLNSLTGLWSEHPWDLDLTWADNMYGGGDEPFRDRVSNNASQPQFNLEYKNRIREVRDLLFNTDQMYQLIDEHANMAHGPAALSITDADRAQWDYNPILTNTTYGVILSKGGHGLFYQFPAEQPGISNSFYGGPQLMKRYVLSRMSILDSLAADSSRPSKPVLTSISATNFPINKLLFRSSTYVGASAFGAMKWRVGEITRTDLPTFDPYAPRKYEIDSAWESPELPVFNSDFRFPASELHVGRTYRARVKMKDINGRWSNWSAPVEFTAGEADNAVALAENLRVTELMYNSPAGSAYDFIELKNINTTDFLEISGVSFTSGVSYSFPANTILPAGGFVVLTGSSDLADFRTHYGLSGNVNVFGPYSGNFSNDGETVTIKTAAGGADIISFQYSDGRGWPLSADGAGHSLVVLDSALVAETRGSLNYGDNWRASAFIGGSPGAIDAAPPTGILINEITANTTYLDPSHPEYDSNDWIELLNSSNGNATFDNLYLSDDAANLKKWALPTGTLAAGQRIAFDEVTGFHSPITNGFGLSSAGEQVFLSYLPGTSADRVIDAVSFKGQETGISWSRVPDGGRYFSPALPTRAAVNGSAISSVVISEIAAHPRPTIAHPEDNTADEFFELYNPGNATLNLYNDNGPWRIDGGIKFSFPPNTTLPPHGAILLTSVNTSDSVALDAFRQTYGIGSDVTVLGPYQGKLGNTSDRVSVEKPQAPEIVGDPLVWVIVDEAIYSRFAPWPESADGSGLAFTRTSTSVSGNDASNWIAAVPTPGAYGSASNGDSDGDGIPDDWETLHNLNPHDPSDAALDPDGDGMTNLQEYRAGTDPQSAASTLAMGASVSEGNQIKLSFTAMAGKGYRIEYSDTLAPDSWTVLVVLDPPPQNALVQFNDTPPGTRFYRVILSN